MTLQEFLNTTPASSRERLWLTTQRDGSHVIVGGHEQRPGGGSSFSGTFGHQLKRISESFEQSTAWWVEFAQEYERGLVGDRFVFVADGKAHSAEVGEQPLGALNGAHLGFGGARMLITSGKWSGVSNSVWFHANVPPALRELLPDNATLESAAVMETSK